MALVILIVGLAIASALLPLHRIPDAMDDIGAWGPPAAIAIGAVLLTALVPRTAVSIGCGALFGALVGAVVSLAAALIACVVTFVVGRWLGREAIAAHVGDRIGRLDAWLASTGLLSVIVVRLLPIAPYGLVGYAYGTTSVRTRNYLLGSLIGATPSAFSYAAVGAAVVEPGQIRFITFLPAAIGFVVTGCAAIYWWRLRRSRSDSATAEAGEAAEASEAAESRGDEEGHRAAAPPNTTVPSSDASMGDVAEPDTDALPGTGAVPDASARPGTNAAPEHTDDVSPRPHRGR